jgi:hypothetical protein
LEAPFPVGVDLTTPPMVGSRRAAGEKSPYAAHQISRNVGGGFRSSPAAKVLLMGHYCSLSLTRPINANPRILSPIRSSPGPATFTCKAAAVSSQTPP